VVVEEERGPITRTWPDIQQGKVRQGASYELRAYSISYSMKIPGYRERAINCYQMDNCGAKICTATARPVGGW
jgi:hypothetical protein